MDAVLGHKPATAPSVVVDTSASNENHQGDHYSIVDQDESLFTEHNKDTLTTQSLPSDSTKAAEIKSKPQGKSKKKRSKGEQFEMAMNGMIKQFIDAQQKIEE